MATEYHAWAQRFQFVQIPQFLHRLNDWPRLFAAKACILNDEKRIMLVNGALFLIESGWARPRFIVQDSTEHSHLPVRLELSGEPECFVLVRIDIRKAQISISWVMCGEERQS